MNTKVKQFLSGRNLAFIGIFVVLMLAGALCCLMLHEIAHALTLLLCGGNVQSFFFGTNSYVGGFVAPQYITIIALSSILVPLAISISTIWIKNTYFNMVALGFSMSNFMNAILGLFAFVLIDDKAEKLTYDIPLAIEYSSNQGGTFVLSFLLFAGCAACMYFIADRLSGQLEKRF